eukprot:7389377-Prymnesium_polylepis.1
MSTRLDPDRDSAVAQPRLSRAVLCGAREANTRGAGRKSRSRTADSGGGGGGGARGGACALG